MPLPLSALLNAPRPSLDRPQAAPGPGPLDARDSRPFRRSFNDSLKQVEQTNARRDEAVTERNLRTPEARDRFADRSSLTDYDQAVDRLSHEEFDRGDAVEDAESNPPEPAAEPVAEPVSDARQDATVDATGRDSPASTADVIADPDEQSDAQDRPDDAHKPRGEARNDGEPGGGEPGGVTQGADAGGCESVQVT
jgi:hypothetical protein